MPDVEQLVHAAVRRLGLRPWDADYEDACQEARIVAWQRTPEYDGRTTIKAWLSLCIRHHLADWNRARRGRGLHKGRGEGQPTVHTLAFDPGANEEPGIDLADEAEWLRRRVAELPDPTTRGICEAVLAGQTFKDYGLARGRSRAWAAIVVKRSRDFFEHQHG